MTSWADTVRAVEERARRRCEYCGMHQTLQGATFHVEHIVPSSRGGPSTEDNLALACPTCNLHKSDRVESPDPESSALAPLFHPRTQQWADHFRWDNYEVVGTTPTGRATVSALDLNHPRRVLIRRAEELFGLFPPP
jgi:5-methylcytosine-specific restriction endonuclease McrA